MNRIFKKAKRDTKDWCFNPQIAISKTDSNSIRMENAKTDVKKDPQLRVLKEAAEKKHLNNIIYCFGKNWELLRRLS